MRLNQFLTVICLFIAYSGCLLADDLWNVKVVNNTNKSLNYTVTSRGGVSQSGQFMAKDTTNLPVDPKELATLITVEGGNIFAVSPERRLLQARDCSCLDTGHLYQMTGSFCPRFDFDDNNEVTLTLDVCHKSDNETPGLYEFSNFWDIFHHWIA